MVVLAVSPKKIAKKSLSGYEFIPEKGSPVNGVSSTLNWFRQRQQKYSLVQIMEGNLPFQEELDRNRIKKKVFIKEDDTIGVSLLWYPQQLAGALALAQSTSGVLGGSPGLLFPLLAVFRLECLFVCFVEWGDYKSGSCEKLTEASPVSDRANASWAQIGPTTGQG
ncbi:hypothetical protein DUI87_28131 [Hirundo rustica rustica]|uniref:Uncharacterized protein n=1 Tax=Hirundo rustica rustica TaxID=333673 RepID=A0A3M0J4Z5_HIRRU|nr:hypothetical protein DUI87_28131 [Hirundo rustica rustica]